MITAGLMLLSAVAAWVAKELLIDRRDRTTITADRDAARAEVARLSTQHASDVADLAKADRRQRLDKAHAEALAGKLNAARDRNKVLTGDLYVFENRRHYLPTIDGNKANILDAIDTLGIGMVLDCADPVDPPIAAEVRGNVVVLDSKRGRA